MAPHAMLSGDTPVSPQYGPLPFTPQYSNTMVIGYGEAGLITEHDVSPFGLCPCLPGAAPNPNAEIARVTNIISVASNLTSNVPLQTDFPGALCKSVWKVLCALKTRSFKDSSVTASFLWHGVEEGARGDSVPRYVKIYKSVIDDVLAGVRDAFLDEGVDEQVLQELRQIWEQKLESSKAIEANPEPEAPQPQYLQKEIARNSLPSKPGNVYSYQSAHNAVHNSSQQSHMVSQHTNQMQVQGNQSQAVSQSQQQQQQHHQHHQQHQQQHQPPLQQQPQHHHQHLRQEQSQHQQHQQPQQQQQTQQSQAQQQQSQSHQQSTNTHSTTPQTVIVADPSKQVPIQITLPAQAGGESRVLTIQVPASALQGNQLQQVLTGPVITATMALPVHLASSLLQQHVNAALQGQVTTAVQLQSSSLQQNNAGHLQNQSNSIRQLDGMDGTCDTSDEEEDDDDEEEDVDDEEENDEKEEDENEEENTEGQEEEPLNSGDDVSDEDPSDLFDTDNVVITRTRNKWKFHLKDGIMNLNGKDFVFQRAGGDAEW
ncbi:Transcription initiation factor IIA subunit 1 [Gryllus bimaculatus]|nr:Transcription initiation factor IIA subunit 1 [Gryllus bimaculatus]